MPRDGLQIIADITARDNFWGCGGAAWRVRQSG